MPNVPKPEDLATWIRDTERRLRALEGGQRVSVENLAAYRYADYQQTFDPAWAPLWEVPHGYVQHDSIRVQVYASVPAATTGEVRLRAVNVTGYPTTDAIALPAGATIATFSWLVPGLIVPSQGILYHLEARVTAGPGYVALYPPLVVRSSPGDLIAATASGV